MIADISVNQLRLISKATSNLLMWMGKKTIEYYYVNKGPVIFRTIISIDDSSKFSTFLQQFSMPGAIVLKKPLRDNSNEILEETRKMKEIALTNERRIALQRNKPLDS